LSETAANEHAPDDRERLRTIAGRLDRLITEADHPGATRLDTLETLPLLQFINEQDAGVAVAVERVLPAVVIAVDLITACLRDGGRLFYLGAGTSGRLGVLDASECPPTFGTDPDLVVGVIAGGSPALLRSSEGLEDDGEQGWTDLEAAGAGPGDIVVGITASTRTPYVVEGLHRAAEAGLRTVYLTCNPREEAGAEADVSSAPGVVADVTIAPVVGPEVVAGSTRMKAGTATKMVLNMLTTATFIRMGRSWGNLMVGLRPVSDKLRARARRIVMLACGVEFDEAHETLVAVGEDTRAAILVLAGGRGPAEALEEADGPLRLRELLDGRGPAHQEPIDEE